MIRIRRILYASDFSDAWRAAFRRAIDLAKADRAELLVVHLLRMVPLFIGEGDIPPNVWGEVEAGQRAGAQTRLGRLVA